MIKRIFSTAIALAILSSVAVTMAQGGKDAAQGGGKSGTITGILQDKACSGKSLKDSDPYAAASKHTKTCALMGPCAGSGFGVITKEGKFLKFDAKGDEQAKALLEKTTKKDNLVVAVEGQMKGDLLEVKSLKEASS